MGNHNLFSQKTIIKLNQVSHHSLHKRKREVKILSRFCSVVGRHPIIFMYFFLHKEWAKKVIILYIFQNTCFLKTFLLLFLMISYLMDIYHRIFFLKLKKKSRRSLVFFTYHKVVPANEFQSISNTSKFFLQQIPSSTHPKFYQLTFCI